MRISKFVSVGILSAVSAMFISGCSGANVGSEMRMSDVNSNMETRCVELDMRNNSEMEKVFMKFDGWRVFYISEYTTDNKIGTSGNVCFERQKH